MATRRTKTTTRKQAVSPKGSSADDAARRRILEAALRAVAAGGELGLAHVAEVAGVSHATLCSQFTNRVGLFRALVGYVDEQYGVAAGPRRVATPASGIQMLRELAATQARVNPQIRSMARVLESVRRDDPAAEQAWLDRSSRRLEGCRAVIAKLAAETLLRPELGRDVAAETLWTLTSLRTWEDLVVQRGWSAEQYEQRLSGLLITLLTGLAVAV